MDSTPGRGRFTASVARLLGGLSVAFALAFLAPAPGATASASRADGARPAAHLDPSFGSAGRVLLPPQRRGRVISVLMRDDSLVVGLGGKLMRLDPDGRVDESFGDRGMLMPSPPPTGSFEIRGLAVDGQNRLVVAGTVEWPDEEDAAPFEFGWAHEKPRTVRVLRYFQDGAIDPGFGEQGAVETDFGLPRPVDRSGEYLLPKPWLEATGVTVDREDRVVLTGGASAGAHFGCFHDWNFNTLTYAAFVARLTEDGRPDAAFGGGDGIFAARSTDENPLGAEFSAAPLVGPDAGVTYGAGAGRCPVRQGSEGLARLTPMGTPSGSFGRSGIVRWGATATAFGRGRSMMALGWVSPWYSGKEPLRAIVRRFGPQGQPDPSYGRRGQTVIASPGGPASALEALAVDRRGRVLLGGTMYGAKEVRDPRDGTRRHPSFFALVRLGADGRLDRRFGPHGRIATRFGSLRIRQSSLLLDSRGRAIAVGSYRGDGETRGLAVARYAIGR